MKHIETINPLLFNLNDKPIQENPSSEGTDISTNDSGNAYHYFGILSEVDAIVENKDKSNFLNKLIRLKTYCTDRHVHPVAVHAFPNLSLSYILKTIGFYQVLASHYPYNYEELIQLPLYDKVCQDNQLKHFNFQIIYALIIQESEDQPLSKPNDSFLQIINKFEQQSIIIKVNAISITNETNYTKVYDPVEYVHNHPIPDASKKAPDRYYQFNLPKLSVPIHKTLPLLVPDGLLNLSRDINVPYYMEGLSY